MSHRASGRTVVGHLVPKLGFLAGARNSQYGEMDRIRNPKRGILPSQISEARYLVLVY